MSSFSMLEKVRYTGTPSDVVALKEYIVYKSEQTDEKYILCKFVNNLNQRLYGMRFEISQYDETDALLEKVTLSYDKFSALGGENFVPSAKCALNPRCKNISYKLLYAAFDKVKWENGSFSDNDYQFKRYVHDENLLKAQDKTSEKAPREKKKPQEKGKREKDEVNAKTPFAVRDVTHLNHAKFPTAFRVLSVLIVIAFVCATAFLLTHNSARFSIGDYDLVLYGNDSVGVYGYNGKEKELVIPAKIGDYTVTRIETGAFKKAKITAVGFRSEKLTIAKNAFKNCKSLTTVVAEGKVYVTSYAFNACSNIKRIDMPQGTVLIDGFYRSGSVSKTQYRFGKKLTQDDQEIFGVHNETTIGDMLD